MEMAIVNFDRRSGMRGFSAHLRDVSMWADRMIIGSISVALQDSFRCAFLYKDVQKKKLCELRTYLFTHQSWTGGEQLRGEWEEAFRWQ